MSGLWMNLVEAKSVADSLNFHCKVEQVDRVA